MTLVRSWVPFTEALSSRAMATTLGYIAALFGAELLLAQGGFLVGGISHLVLLMVLIAHHVLSHHAAHRPILLALTLPSLLRLVSLTVTVNELPEVAWLAMIGAPTLLATVLVIRVVPVGLGALLAWPADALVQVLVALSGIGHGILLYLILRPPALVPMDQPGALVAGVIVLVLFVAALEEVIFRGVVQSVAMRITGSSVAAVLTGSAVYACLFVSAESPVAPAAMFVIGVAFGTTVSLTRSLWGVTGAHALMIIGALIVWPAVLQ